MLSILQERVFRLFWSKVHFYFLPVGAHPVCLEKATE